jgi:four helix bundle protein
MARVCFLVEKAHPFVMHDFRRLTVWQRSRDLAVAVDQLTRAFPRRDRGVVASQLRRAALGIPAAISEGCGKSSRKETIRYLQMASGSASETENHLLLASDLEYLTAEVRERYLGEVKTVQRMAKLIANLP